MARIVSRMSVKTVINQIKKGTRDKIWISGTKFDRWSSGDEQFMNIKFARPQEVSIVHIGNSWSSDNSISTLLIKDFKTENNEIKTLKSIEMCDYGIKFFKNQESAEKYFLEKTHKLFTLVNPMFALYKELQFNIKNVDPHFIALLETRE